MPRIDINVIQEVLTPKETRELVERVSETVIALEGEAPRPVTHVAITEQLAAWWLSTYATRMGRLYPQMLSQRFGMATAVNAVIEAARDPDVPDLPAAAEDLAHELTLFGTYEQAKAAIAAWFAAGADSVNLVLPPNRPKDKLSEILNVITRARATHQSSVGRAASAARGRSSSRQAPQPNSSASLASAGISDSTTG
jgi:4-oxalocrotonate tautomerase